MILLELEFIKRSSKSFGITSCTQMNFMMFMALQFHVFSQMGKLGRSEMFHVDEMHDQIIDYKLF